MSTNYYQVGPKCECCGRELESARHLGKSSAGRFMFQATPSVGNYEKWITEIRALGKLGWTLRDEYGSTVTLEELVMASLEKNKKATEAQLLHKGCYLDAEGWEFHESDFS